MGNKLWELAKKVVKDSLTGIDGVSYDGMKVVGYPSFIASVGVYLGNALKTMITGGTLDYVAFGTGFAALAGALGLIAAGVAVKGHTEPSGQ